MESDADGRTPAKALLSEGAGYTLVEVGQQALALAVLPVFFFFLTAEDFGVITLSMVLTQFGTAIGTLGLDFSVMRLYFRWSDAERARVVGSVTAFSCVWSLVLAGAAHVALSSGSAVPASYWPLSLGWWSGLILSLRGVHLALVRVRGAIRQYATFVLGGAALQVVAQAVCVVAGLGAMGYLLGYTAGAAASALLAFVVVRREYDWAGRPWGLPKMLVSYTVRILPSVLFSRFIAVADRLVLARWVSTEALGVYGAASRFTTPVKFLSGGFKMALAPVLTRQERAGELDASFTVMGRFIVVGMLFVGSLVAAGVWLTRLTPWREDYFDLQRLVALLLVAQFLSALSYLGQLRLYYSTRPGGSNVVVGVNAVALITGLGLFVPSRGATGAAIAELLASAMAVAALLAVTVMRTRRFGPWPTVAAPLLTFLPAVAAAWMAGAAGQITVFALTSIGYAAALVIYLRKHAPAVIPGFWGR